MYDKIKIRILYWPKVIYPKVEGLLDLYRQTRIQKNKNDELEKAYTTIQSLKDSLQEKTVQLELSDAEHKSFCYSVSHDLKAPLRAIDGFSKLLVNLYGNSLNEEAQSFIATIRNSSQQVNQLIDDLMEYSSLQRIQIYKENIKTVDLVAYVTSLFEEELNKGNFTLEMDIPDIEVIADSKGLTMALHNLLENAIKFSKEKSKPIIKIRVEENESFWIFSVKDNGVGFDMNYHQRIFEIFQKLHNDEDFPGTGIGLALVNKAMQKMNGKVWAESIPDVGSTFYLELPKSF